MLGFALAVLPFPMPQNVLIALVLLGIGYTTLSLKVQRTLGSPQRMREIQAKIKAVTTEMQEMAKRKEDVSKKQAEIMPLMGESMRLQMKSMFVILPIFYLMYYLALPFLLGQFNGASVKLAIFTLTTSNIFFLTALVVGLVGSMALLQYEKKKVAAIQESRAPNAQPSAQAAEAAD